MLTQICYCWWGFNMGRTFPLSFITTLLIKKGKAWATVASSPPSVRHERMKTWSLWQGFETRAAAGLSPRHSSTLSSSLYYYFNGGWGLKLGCEWPARPVAGDGRNFLGLMPWKSDQVKTRQGIFPAEAVSGFPCNYPSAVPPSFVIY